MQWLKCTQGKDNSDFNQTYQCHMLEQNKSQNVQVVPEENYGLRKIVSSRTNKATSELPLHKSKLHEGKDRTKRNKPSKQDILNKQQLQRDEGNAFSFQYFSFFFFIFS